MLMRVDLVGWSLLMIALAMGYSVCLKAGKESNQALKMIGYVIGVIVLVVSLILAISDLGSRIRMRRGGVVAPRRAGETTRPITAPRTNIPVLPKAPTAPRVESPAVPTPPKP